MQRNAYPAVTQPKKPPGKPLTAHDLDRIERVVPQEMRDAVRWTLAGREGVPTWTGYVPSSDKEPIDPLTGKLHRWGSPVKWRTFDEAMRAARNNIGMFCGVGLFLSGGPWVVLDLDNVQSDGRWTETANRLFFDPLAELVRKHCPETFHATEMWMETSASGTGFHVIYRGRLPKPPGAKSFPSSIEDALGKGTKLEAFDGTNTKGRYIALTGKVGPFEPSSKLPLPVLRDVESQWLLGFVPKDKPQELPPRPAIKKALDAQARKQQPADLAQRRVKKVIEQQLDAIAQAPEGTRNTTLNKEAMRAFRLADGADLDQNTVAAQLEAAGQVAGLSAAEVAATVRSAAAGAEKHGPAYLAERERPQTPTRSPQKPADEPQRPKAQPKQLGDIVALWAAQGPLVPLATGFPTLDAMLTGGPRTGDVFSVVGAPNAGKTLFLAQLADRWANEGNAVGFVALDEHLSFLAERFMQRRDVSRAACHRRSTDDLDAMRNAASGCAIVFYGYDDDLDALAEQVAATAKERGTVGVLCIDSTQALADRMRDGDADRFGAIADAMHYLHDLAMRLRLLVVASCEMNRSGYRTQEAAQMSNDLAVGSGSGKIEYLSRLLVALRSVAGDGNVIELRVAKNKWSGEGGKGEHGEGDPGIGLRIERRTQTLHEQAEPIARPDMSLAKVAQRQAQASGDAATLALVVAKHPGLLSKDAEIRWARSTGGGVRRFSAAVDMLAEQLALVVVPGPRTAKRLFLDGSKLDDAVLDELTLVDRAVVAAATPQAANTSTAGQGG
jgi:replicative DNA helicase